jgi:hypothetical protein
MKACCDMIHEVDPAIRIYSSTWRHCPDWNGYLDIWGVGHYGCFPVAEMQARKAAGESIWFTTDGQMCTDTPFCAVERLLPHYCFKYGADAYEFWGVSWLTYDPWRFGWHSYIYQSSTPGESYYVRIRTATDFSLTRRARRRSGSGDVRPSRSGAGRVEDFEYLTQLKTFAEKHPRRGKPSAARRIRRADRYSQRGRALRLPHSARSRTARRTPPPGRNALDRLSRQKH